MRVLPASTESCQQTRCCHAEQSSIAFKMGFSKQESCLHLMTSTEKYRHRRYGGAPGRLPFFHWQNSWKIAKPPASCTTSGTAWPGVRQQEVAGDKQGSSSKRQCSERVPGSQEWGAVRAAAVSPAHHYLTHRHANQVDRLGWFFFFSKKHSGAAFLQDWVMK